MPSIDARASGRAYYRSLDDLAQTPEFRRFVDKEFPGYAGELFSNASRRDFLKVMGASMMLAGLTGCRWPEEKIVPATSRTEGRTPGVAVFYATAMELAGVASPLLVSSFDGRPMKIDGNPEHPESQGATTVWAQASVLEMYDPDRSTMCRKNDGKQLAPLTWDELKAATDPIFKALKSADGAEFVVLSEATSSPTVHRLRKDLAKAYPKSQWVEYDPLSRDRERSGAKLALGQPLRTKIDYAKARVIVTLDADPFYSGATPVSSARGYADGRRAPSVKGKDSAELKSFEMNRLYAIEATMTVTGSNADHRFPVNASAIPTVAAHLAAELFINQGVAVPAGAADLKSALAAYTTHPKEFGWVVALAKDLKSRDGESIVVAGPGQPESVHALVHAINAGLGSFGKTYSYIEDGDDAARPDHATALAQLAADLKGGKVDTLLILGGNPAFTAPADLEFAAAIASAKNSIHLGLYVDETAAAAKLHINRAHFLESWGDARSYEGRYSVVQPLIAPLWGGKTPAEVLALALGEGDAKAHDLVQATFKDLAKGNVESAWRHTLHDGFLKDSEATTLKVDSLNGAAIAGALKSIPAEAPKTDRNALEVVFTPCSKVLDGRFSNLGWLQELPDPMTKIAWDNAAIMSPQTANDLGVEDEEVVTLTVDGKSLELATFILPGVAANTVQVSLGYGRKTGGRVAGPPTEETPGNNVHPYAFLNTLALKQMPTGPGFNTYTLRTTKSLFTATGAKLTSKNQTYKLATTQDHHSIDERGQVERERRVGVLVREGDLSEFKEHPDFTAHLGMHYKESPLWQLPEYKGHKWGLAIDLNTCIGCNACVVSCQAENNIPVVGKKQVMDGREMHWIRIDRYFKGDPATPEAVHQPVMCVHCENAPCEQVCPVAATVHTEEGLNAMVYNRCVGTRYCSNNCPFKVRRFNFFNYQHNRKDVEKMMFNPEVTVRTRGVMEKCTYCVQRIEHVKITAKNERRDIKDGEIKTACQTTCPTNAIVFGDLANEQSEVLKLHQDVRAYEMLGELYIKPRTAFLSRLRNPNPELTPAEPKHSKDHSAHASA